MEYPPTDNERQVIALITVELDQHFARLDVLGDGLYQTGGMPQEEFVALYEHASGDYEHYRQHIAELNEDDDAWDTAPRKDPADA